MQPVKFYDKKKKCWAIRFGDEVEYFNHENPIHNKRNLEACIKLLQQKEKSKSQEKYL